MTTPEIRLELAAIAKRLAELSKELCRRSPEERAPVASTPMTPKIAAAIRAYRKAHPGMSQTNIARVFNVNPGRVSEALRGVRK